MTEQKAKEFAYIKYAIILIGILGHIVFTIKGERKEKLAERKYHNRAIEGVVEEIKFYENQRGAPSFYISDTCITFGIEGLKLIPFIKQHDSIVKRTGSNTITIYRKDEKGNWVFIKAR